MTDATDETLPGDPDPTPSPGDPADATPAGSPPADQEEGSSASHPGDLGARVREMADREAERVEAELAAHPLAAIGATPITEADLGDTDLHVCPFCDGWGAADPDALLAALPALVERLAPFPQSPVFYRCPDCDGWGRALTGARLGEAGIQPCPSCDGRGYRDKREENLAGGAPLAPEGSPAPPRPAGPDPMRLSPAQGGEPPAPGMVWFDDLKTWAYPAEPSAA